jgi:peroxin-6
VIKGKPAEDLVIKRLA